MGNTNYMGKRRLERILCHNLEREGLLPLYLSTKRNSCDPCWFMYRRSCGYERLTVEFGCDWKYELFVSGFSVKVVCITSRIYSALVDDYVLFDEIQTKYDKDFLPFPLETWFCGGTPYRKVGFYPFKNNECPGLDPEDYICRDIAKKSKGGEA